MSAGRPPHIITPDEVDIWLADSAVRAVTYHRTNPGAARHILEHGIDISRSRIGAYGQGFYTATESDPFFGDVELVVAIRLRDPLHGDQESIGDIVTMISDRLGDRSGRLSPLVAAGIRRELLDLGYDGISVVDGGGDGIDYVIALEAQAAKVVRP